MPEVSSGSSIYRQLDTVAAHRIRSAPWPTRVMMALVLVEGVTVSCLFRPDRAFWAWLDRADRQYQSVIVRRLSDPSPTITAMEIDYRQLPVAPATPALPKAVVAQAPPVHPKAVEDAARLAEQQRREAEAKRLVELEAKRVATAKSMAEEDARRTAEAKAKADEERLVAEARAKADSDSRAAAVGAAAAAAAAALKADQARAAEEARRSAESRRVAEAAAAKAQSQAQAERQAAEAARIAQAKRQIELEQQLRDLRSRLGAQEKEAGSAAERPRVAEAAPPAAKPATTPKRLNLQRSVRPGTRFATDNPGTRRVAISGSTRSSLGKTSLRHGTALDMFLKLELAPTAIPDFDPWPPPRASAWDVVPNQLVLGKSTVPTSFGIISERLTAALDTAGYHQRRFLKVPNGFAIVTQLEKIGEDGSPAKRGRWVTMGTPYAAASFEDFLKGLLFPEVGHYRLIVLVITDQPVVTASVVMSAQDAEEMSSRGAINLPPAISEGVYSSNHNCTALIYQFRKVGKRKGEFVQPSGLSGRDHLTRAQVLAAFRTTLGQK